jgi:hypothetical protein
MSGNRVLLMTLSCRTSAKGNSYLAGWLGKASVVAFAGEPDKFGNPTWDVFLAEPEPKRDSVQRPSASPPERVEAAPAPAPAASDGGTRPDGPPPPQRRYRPEGKAAQRERVAGEVAAAYGLGDRDPDDPLPF